MVLTPLWPLHHYQGHPCIQGNLHSETNDLCRAVPSPCQNDQQRNTNLVALWLVLEFLRSQEYYEANRVCWGPPQTREDKRYTDEILYSR